MVNLPLSGMKTAAPGDAVPCFWAAKDNAAPAAIPTANTIQAFLKFTAVLIPPRPFSLRSGVSQPPDALRFHRKQQCRGARFRPRLGLARRNCPRDSRPVDTRVSAAHRARGNWSHLGKAAGRSWPCSAKARVRWANPTREPGRRLPGEIRSILAVRTSRRRGPEPYLPGVPRRDRARREADRLPSGEKPVRQDAQKSQEWSNRRSTRCAHRDPRIARRVDAPAACQW